MAGLTDAERRGARVLAVLIVLGTISDFVRARYPEWSAAPAFAGAPTTARLETPPAAGVASAVPAPARLDLNSATASQLDALPGIGPVLAQRIVAHRLEHGPFRSVDELLSVHGIGPRLLERLRPSLREPR